MGRHKLVSLDELQKKKQFVCWLGQYEVLAVMTSQGVRVYSAMCPHQGGPLGEGTFANDTVVCPWHGCRYDLLGGRCEDIGACRNVSEMKLAALPFHIEDETDVYVELP